MTNDDILERAKPKDVSGRMPMYPYKKEDMDVIEQIKKALGDLVETYGEVFERVKIKEEAPLKGAKLTDALDEAGIKIPVEWGVKYIQPRHIFFIHDNRLVDVRGKPLGDNEED